MTKTSRGQDGRNTYQPLLTFEGEPVTCLESRPSIITQCRQIQYALNLVRKVGPSDVTVVLQGESGTGKKLFALAIHQLSPRGRGPFISLDCATFPESCVESELFGFEKGAFAGAWERKPGLFELAEGGTLFLDHINRLESTMQMKLRRVLDGFEIQPLGSRHSKTVSLRVIAATSIDLREAVHLGQFREDLYYRLGTVTILLPPLRDREGDIELLCSHFIQVYNHRFGKSVSGITGPALTILKSYHWPGNVRELDSVIRSAIMLAEDEIRENSLPPYLQESSNHSTEEGPRTSN